jgi:hypothetical protein
MRAIVGGIFVLFAALNLYALGVDGIKGLGEALVAGNAWNRVLGVDLLIALGLVLTWLWRDAREHGRSPLPYVLVTMFTGSLGPLLYLLRRPSPASE